MNGNKDIHEATKNRDLEKINKCIEKENKCINEKNNDGVTAMHIAAFEGYDEIIKRISKERNVDMNLKNINGNTALHLASIKGHENIVERLLKEERVNKNCINENEETALHLAVKHNHEHIITRLLQLNKRLEMIKDREGNIPWHIAAKKGNLKLVQLLYNEKTKNEKNHQGNTAIMLITEYGHKNNWLKLVQNVNVTLKNKKGYNIAHIAAINGRKSILKKIIKHYEDLIGEKDSEGNSIVHLAAAYGQINIIRLLRSFKMIHHKNKKKETPLHQATKKGHLNVFLELLKQQANVKEKTKKGYTVVHLAAKYNQLAILKTLSNIEQKDKKKNNALHLASKDGHREIVHYLLKNKRIDINEKNREGDTAVHLAILEGQHDILSELIDHQANLNIQNEYQETPLQLAIEKEDFEIILRLCKEKMINVNTKNYKGESLLHSVLKESYSLF